MPRRPRSKVNRDRTLGISNRQWGMCKKANSFSQLYNVDIVVAIQRPDGRLGGYQSKPGLAQRLLAAAEGHLVGPSDVNKRDERSAQQTVSRADSVSQNSSCVPSICETACETASEWNDESLTPSFFFSPQTHPWELPDAEQAATIETTVDPGTLSSQCGDGFGSSEIVHPKPVSTGNKKAILSLLDRYL